MGKTRHNHYVAQWYQRRFLLPNKYKLSYLDLSPDPIIKPNGDPILLPNGKQKYHNPVKQNGTDLCFAQDDLYSTFIAPYRDDAFVNDDIERMLFGAIDTSGAKAVQAFAKGGMKNYHDHFSDFFEYMDAQKLRTPKGLDWVKKQYTGLDQNTLMREMQALRQMHSSVWAGGVREIVSAKNSDVKFIISDHPITAYNADAPRDFQSVRQDDPSILLKGTQTIFPLDPETCMILTNFEYAENPQTNRLEKKTNPRMVGQGMVRTDAYIRIRELNREEVLSINLIIKSGSSRYVAAGKEEWLYPEREIKGEWKDLGKALLPPSDQLHRFGGEMYMRLTNGRVLYQDAYGRSSPGHKLLEKNVDESKMGPNALCGCGGGRPYKKCCMGKPEHLRPSWKQLSIRERNKAVFNAMNDIFGLKKGLSWAEARRDLTDEKIKRVYEVFSTFWPIDTDIYALLPKPDGVNRAVYTGLIDPRAIASAAVNTTMYCDEIIIQHPMTHPEIMKPEFSPLINPQKFHLEIIRIFILMDYLMPFIDRGYINLIPDLTLFDAHLRSLAMALPHERASGIKISDNEKKYMKRLREDDFKRSIRLIPKDAIQKQISQLSPELSQEEVLATVEYIRTLNEQDPLTPLHEELLAKSGQFTSISLSPSLELCLFMAQATGSFIVTDSKYRWDELCGCQSLYSGLPLTIWRNLPQVIYQTTLLTHSNPINLVNLRMDGIGKEFRALMGDVCSISRQVSDFSKALPLEKRLLPRVAEAIDEVNSAFATISSDAETESRYPDLNTRLHLLAPLGGIKHHHAQRLLAMSGIERYTKSVPMAIYVEFPQNDEDVVIEDPVQDLESQES